MDALIWGTGAGFLAHAFCKFSPFAPEMLLITGGSSGTAFDGNSFNGNYGMFHNN